ncbi:hypothetical protein niasHS_006069 [Heterodera schachtii]|uniref:Secreted protein n=1 Tax=Heterodera schachtii TaxID=97005 RepID=A0ABD2JW33_HETSC
MRPSLFFVVALFAIIAIGTLSLVDENDPQDVNRFFGATCPPDSSAQIIPNSASADTVANSASASADIHP